MWLNAPLKKIKNFFVGCWIRRVNRRFSIPNLLIILLFSSPPSPPAKVHRKSPTNIAVRIWWRPACLCLRRWRLSAQQRPCSSNRTHLCSYKYTRNWINSLKGFRGGFLWGDRLFKRLECICSFLLVIYEDCTMILNLALIEIREGLGHFMMLKVWLLCTAKSPCVIWKSDFLLEFHFENSRTSNVPLMELSVQFDWKG